MTHELMFTQKEKGLRTTLLIVQNVSMSWNNAKDAAWVDENHYGLRIVISLKAK